MRLKVSQNFSTFSTLLNIAFLLIQVSKAILTSQLRWPFFPRIFFHRKNSCPDPFSGPRRDGDFVQIICQKIIRGRNIFLNKWSDPRRRDFCSQNNRQNKFFIKASLNSNLHKKDCIEFNKKTTSHV